MKSCKRREDEELLGVLGYKAEWHPCVCARSSAQSLESSAKGSQVAGGLKDFGLRTCRAAAGQSRPY